MSKVRDISGLANIIKTDANGNVTFVSGSTTLMAISSSGAVTSTGTIGGSNSATLATTGSNTFTGQQYVSNTNAPVNFTDTASLYTDGGLRVGKDAYVSGTLYLNNLTVYGTQSVNYITSSQLDIADNIITVNTSTPAIRFGGIAVRDSGSLGTGLTGSLLWDSQNNHWVYTNPSGSSYSGGMLISGPRASSLGEEQGTTFNALMKGQGGDHITSSGIFESGSNVGIGTSSPTLALSVIGQIRAGYDTGAGLTIGLSPIGVPNNDLNAYVVWGDAASFGGNNGDLIYIPRSSTSADHRFYTANTGLATEKMRITYEGKVGIGTNNPNVILDVQQSNITNMGISFMNTYGASGASGSTVDISSKLVGSGLTGQVGSMIRTGKEGDYSSGATRDAYMSFSTAQNDALNERMRITSGGNVGVGRDDPSYALDVYGSIRASSSNTFSPSLYLNFNNTNIARFLADQNSVYIISQNAYPVEIQTNGSSKALFGSGAISDVSFFTYSGYKQFFSGGDQYNVLLNNAGTIMYLNYQGNGGIRAGTAQQVLYAGSDIRIKKDISLVDSTLDKVLALSPKTFKYKDNKADYTYYGFIAQDMEEVFPELVRTDNGISMCNDEEIVNQKSIESYGLVWASILTKAIQELKAEINELKAQING